MFLAAKSLAICAGQIRGLLISEQETDHSAELQRLRDSHLSRVSNSRSGSTGLPM